MNVICKCVHTCHFIVKELYMYVYIYLIVLSVYCNLTLSLSRLEGEVDRLEADQSAVVYTKQIETLEKTLAQVKNYS